MVRSMILCLALALAPSFAPAQSAEVIAAVNALRVGNNRAPLAPNPELQAAAEAHAADMAQHGYFSHTGRNGSTHARRAKAKGYNWRYLTENIAQAANDVDAVLAQWMASPPHRKNLLNRRAQDFGLARAGNGIWVLMLGKER